MIRYWMCWRVGGNEHSMAVNSPGPTWYRQQQSSLNLLRKTDNENLNWFIGFGTGISISLKSFSDPLDLDPKHCSKSNLFHRRERTRALANPTASPVSTVFSPKVAVASNPSYIYTVPPSHCFIPSRHKCVINLGVLLYRWSVFRDGDHKFCRQLYQQPPRGRSRGRGTGMFT